jgi:DNA ligase-associated metallophosphoesterase
MHQPTLHLFQKQHLWLAAHRCIFWEEEQAIILSDVHFGKTGHFRKNGIAIPQTIFKEDLQRLVELITHFKPKKIIVVGDLFHSHANKEMNLFLKWRYNFPMLEFHLVKGNHDILKDEWYEEANIILHMHLDFHPFTFVHDISDAARLPNTNYFFSGHIHPGIQIKGISKQSLRFPCFYFGQDHAVLPAFSRFTGLASIKTNKKDTVFAIVNDAVIQISNLSF